jgi:hypothetical protein
MVGSLGVSLPASAAMVLIIVEYIIPVRLAQTVVNKKEPAKMSGSFKQKIV